MPRDPVQVFGLFFILLIVAGIAYFIYKSTQKGGDRMKGMFYKLTTTGYYRFVKMDSGIFNDLREFVMSAVRVPVIMEHLVLKEQGNIKQYIAACQALEKGSAPSPENTFIVLIMQFDTGLNEPILVRWKTDYVKIPSDPQPEGLLPDFKQNFFVKFGAIEDQDLLGREIQDLIVKQVRLYPFNASPKFKPLAQKGLGHDLYLMDDGFLLTAPTVEDNSELELAMGFAEKLMFALQNQKMQTRAKKEETQTG